MSKITLQQTDTVQQVFDLFIASKTAQGIAPKTIETYQGHYKTFGIYTNLDIPIDQLSQKNVAQAISTMQAKGLSQNSIASYIRCFRAFTNWAKDNGYTDLYIPQYKTVETPKEIYTDAELKLLLKKPNMKTANFNEYRNWVIINFLMNCGCRAGTLLAIKNQDIDFDNKQVIFRHTKNGRIQTIPLCNEMILILKGYMKIRQGKPTDQLFCKGSSEILTYKSLKYSIGSYNQRRGVTKTSIHLFRHTFAKKYLIDCDGNAFTLQRLLGHSTLDMTRHYCNIFNSDLQNGFENHCPLNAIKGTGHPIKMR